MAASSTRNRRPSGRAWTWITRDSSTPALAAITRPGSNARARSEPSNTWFTIAARSSGVGGAGWLK